VLKYFGAIKIPAFSHFLLAGAIERERALDPLMPCGSDRQRAYKNLSIHFEYEDGNSVSSRNLTRSQDVKTTNMTNNKPNFQASLKQFYKLSISNPYRLNQDSLPRLLTSYCQTLVKF
jgi:hypothetical protein